MILLRFLYIVSCLCIVSFYLLYNAPNQASSLPYVILEADIRNLKDEIQKINNKAEYGYFYKHDREMLMRHARNGTVWIVSTNSAMLPLSFNLLCSIASFDPSLLDFLVFHAVDVEAKIALERHRWHDQWQFNATKKGAIPTFGFRWGFGVLYNPLFSGGSEQVTWNMPEYEKMMRQRPSFFLTIIRTMKLNIIFGDVDIVYYHDPLPFVHHSYLSGDADLSISTDARNMFGELNGEWDKYNKQQEKLPSFCGGFFFAQSNHRVISFFEKLEKFLEEAYDTNDQTGFERVLEERTDLRIVGRLPRGLSTKPGINSDSLVSDRGVIPPLDRSLKENENILSVHILDQWQFINGVTYEKQQAKWENDRHILSGDDVQVMKHANFPGHQKIQKMHKYGWWLLDDDQETCLSSSSS